MKKKKITRLLSALNDRELSRFRLFLEADFFSGDQGLVHYFDVMLEDVLKASDDLEEEAFFQRLFPGDNFDNKRIARMGSQLVSLLYRYLAVEFLGGDDLRSWSLVLDALEQRRQEEPLALTLSAMERSLSRAPESTERLLQHYRLLEIQAGRPPGRLRGKSHVTQTEIRQALDRYYELARLRLECASLNRTLVFGETAEGNAAESATTILDGPTLADLYRLVRANLEAPENFDRYIALAEALSAALESQKPPYTYDLREICRYQLNACVRLINLHPNDRQKTRELLRELYDEQLEAGVMFENNLLPPWHFKNMVTNLVLLGNASEASRRIEEFQDRLQDDYQQNAVVFAKGYLAFHTGAFADAKTQFSILLRDYKDTAYGLDGRLTLLRSLFELEEVDVLQYQLDAARVYLHRLKGSKFVSEFHLGLYRDAVRNITKLATIYFGQPDKRASKLRKYADDLEQQETVLYKDWFLKKSG